MNSGSSRPRRALVVRAGVAFVGLLVARGLAVYGTYFYEEDEISLAAGASALVRDDIGDVYRYTAQWGYYQVVAVLDRVFGSDVSLIPYVMKGLSVLSGALLPVLGCFLFTAQLSSRRRWLTATLLAACPIVWKSSQYGNTGLLSATLATAAVAILSNRPTRRIEAGALLLFGFSILVRADAILLAPVVAWLVWHDRGSLRAALGPGIATALGLLAAYAAILTLDPRADDAAAAVVTHFRTPTDHFFWEYLVWAVSPIPLALAVWGVRALLDERPRLLVALLCWMLPPFAFYFAGTTTPRYFLLTVAPLAVAGAVGIDELAGRIRVWTGPRIAWTAILGAATLHLFVGFGHFHGRLLSPLLGPSIITHDRGMPTGALLYDAYFRGGFLAQSLRGPGFGESASPHWEGPLFEATLGELARDRTPQPEVLVLLHSGWGHAFHFHAQAAGATYLSRAPGPASQPFKSLTRMTIGGHPFATIGRASPPFSALRPAELAGFDEVWVSGEAPFPTAEERAKLPRGLVLVRTLGEGGRMHVYAVARRPG